MVVKIVGVVRILLYAKSACQFVETVHDWSVSVCQCALSFIVLSLVRPCEIVSLVY